MTDGTILGDLARGKKSLLSLPISPTSGLGGSNAALKNLQKSPSLINIMYFNKSLDNSMDR
jgi:hypothetical protein